MPNWDELNQKKKVFSTMYSVKFGKGSDAFSPVQQARKKRNILWFHPEPATNKYIPNIA